MSKVHDELVSVGEGLNDLATRIENIQIPVKTQSDVFINLMKLVDDLRRVAGELPKCSVLIPEVEDAPTNNVVEGFCPKEWCAYHDKLSNVSPHICLPNRCVATDKELVAYERALRNSKDMPSSTLLHRLNTLDLKPPLTPAERWAFQREVTRRKFELGETL